MHLVIVTRYHYPDGGPVAARHLALAAGLAVGGHRVSFILLHNDDPPWQVRQDQSVSWTNVATAGGGSSPLRWRISAIRRMGPALDEIAESSAIDAVLVADRDPVIMESALRIARNRTIPALYELTEYLEINSSAGVRGSLEDHVFLTRHLSALNGVLVISLALKDFVAGWASTPTLLLGSIVDMEKSPELPRIKMTKTLVVGYAGSLSERKDGVLSLLRAASLTASQLSPEIDIRIEILGNTETPDGQKAISEAQTLGLENKVTFRGLVPHREVYKYLAKCHMLALPRPISRQATGGFPTKLGEYLATARPVLVTAVGDIPRYLRHDVNCIMAAPNDVESLARSIQKIGCNYGNAQRVGQRGRELAERTFAAPVQAQNLVRFVEQLSGSRA